MRFHACALCLGIRRTDGASGLRRLDQRTKCGEHAGRVLAKLRDPRLLIRIVSRQRRQPIDVGVDARRGRGCEIPSARHGPYNGVRVHDRREHVLDRGQHLLRVNDPFVGGLRSLNGSVDDPHHGQDRDDGQYGRSAKCAGFSHEVTEQTFA